MCWFSIDNISLSCFLSFCSYQIQQQAVLVLQENQDLINQLEEQHAEAKATHSRHNTEGIFWNTERPKKNLKRWNKFFHKHLH